jgi:hypothetical protein
VWNLSCKLTVDRTVRKSIKFYLGLVCSAGHAGPISTNIKLVRFYGLTGARTKMICLLECCAVWSGRSLPTFQRFLLSPLSGRRVIMEAALEWKHVWNVGKLLPDHKAQYTRRHPSLNVKFTWKLFLCKHKCYICSKCDDDTVLVVCDAVWTHR